MWNRALDLIISAPDWWNLRRIDWRLRKSIGPRYVLKTRYQKWHGCHGCKSKRQIHLATRHHHIFGRRMH